MDTETRRSKRDSKAYRTPVVTGAEYPVMGAPVVFEADELGLKEKKKARRGSSKAARRAEDVERRVSRAVNRVARAVDKGVSTYVERRDESASRRRDGALVDFYENVARGASEAISEASPALVDVAKILNSKRSRRLIRRTLNGLPRIPFLT